MGEVYLTDIIKFFVQSLNLDAKVYTNYELVIEFMDRSVSFYTSTLCIFNDARYY